MVEKYGHNLCINFTQFINLLRLDLVLGIVHKTLATLTMISWRISRTSFRPARRNPRSQEMPSLLISLITRPIVRS
ncbi:hypothetical protein SAMN05660330_02467 [Desulforhopalus singaporensis]|uniref:Uncharacterized protein n=1 Tax=Desulforhopalus singaporensis TaxID=91360 RepID=A0A1H0RXP3_9BACT|nr:hypothetical protein SAMN05660330_02467 [Desulforhopalus singaporensis]